jgi:hypothetical protein
LFCCALCAFFVFISQNFVSPPHKFQKLELQQMSRKTEFSLSFSWYCYFWIVHRVYRMYNYRFNFLWAYFWPSQDVNWVDYGKCWIIHFVFVASAFKGQKQCCGGGTWAASLSMLEPNHFPVRGSHSKPHQSNAAPWLKDLWKMRKKCF